MVRQMTSRNYLLLTPGPLTTTRTVKEAMLFDSCTWDDDYNLGVVQTIRQQLVQLATPADGYTAVLLQVAAATRSKRCSAASSANRAKC